ncbi:MAG: sigma-54 dependent transcriptional regulator [Rikenellaceae bacterium]|nr:sigma-54 dependent transcriptional regulator [Rikenellaceae bacterium]
MDIQAVKQRFGIIGNNARMNRALEVALRVAATDLSVLITGESGVGKEFFPQVIHAYSPRKHGSYIAVNCGAIPEGTIDSELFGHEKGSFTGATDSRKGYFEVADGGTIFLDEVAELPLTTQVRLLRILQTGEFMKVGSSKIQKTNVRVVAATNINLIQAISDGKFREDLYYRLNTVPIVVPPLRERKEDIYLLFRKFASDIAHQYRMPSINLSDDARIVLENYSWRGNIRQLKNVAEQMSAVEETRDIDAEILGKYLPDHDIPILPAVVAGSTVKDDSDRDLLYKFLFDIKGDINELKKMVAELSGVRETSSFVTQGNISSISQNPGLALPAASVAPPQYLVPKTDCTEDFADSEIVDDIPQEEMTKEKMLRDQILRALRRHGGKRKDAAKDLFISERTLYRKIKELGIDEY